MSRAFDHRDPGTPEDEWDAVAPWRNAAQLSLDVERVIVLSAHPDDETLGAGGLIANASAACIPVDVVVITDGEGSHPHLDLRRTRRHEVAAALDDLAPSANLSFLSLPDGGVREHVEEIRRHVAVMLAAADAHTVLLAAPWWGDGHRDHRALGQLARAMRCSGVRVVGYPIWLWHWGDPAEVDVDGWRTVGLSTDVRVAKQRAIGRHETQVRSLAGDPPVLHGMMLQHFARPFEVFVEASDSGADVSASPSFFEDFHQRHADPWGLDGRWYEKRKRDVLLACLPQPMVKRAFEIGCAGGAVTAELRDRAQHVLAIDVSETALAKAAERLDGDPRVELRRANLPAEWPEGVFDLIVLSEVGYFWSRADLADAVDRIVDSLDDEGVFVACHWRHAFADAPLTGDRVHAVLAARPELHQIVQHIEPEFLLDVFVRRKRGAS